MDSAGVKLLTIGAALMLVACGGSADDDGGGDAGVVDPSAVVFSPPGGVFADPFTLALSAGDAGDIRYTTDGTVPTQSSTVYTAPISIDATTTVRAALYVGSSGGVVGSHAYLRAGADARDFSSNLPVVVIDSFGYDINSESGSEGNRPIYPRRLVYGVFIEPDTDGRAEMLDTPDFAGRAGMKVRGNSSQILPKKQYSFEAWGEDDDDTPVSILGMPAESDWVFHAPYGDKALMRNHLAYKWGATLGHYTSRTRHVEVFFNWNDDQIDMADYVGVYVFMEKIKRDPNRVDIDKLLPADTEEPNVTGGYMLKLDIPDDDEEAFETAMGSLWSLIHVYPKADAIVPAQRDFIVDYVNAAEAALFGPSFADATTGYAGYLDVESFIDYYLLTEALKNADSYYASRYFHKPRGGKLVAGPIWDWNVSFGGTTDWETWRPTDWLHDTVGTPWYVRLFEDPAFDQRFADRWRALRQTVLATATLLADVDATAALLEEAQQRNFERWPILGVRIDELDHLNPPGLEQRDTYAKEVAYLRSWLEQRLVWIDGQLGGP